VSTRRRSVGGALLRATLRVARAIGWAKGDGVAYRLIDIDWTDPARGRAVPARLYWPRSAAVDAPVPLIVFSHGIGASRQDYSYLGRHWASKGYASLHVQHVGSDNALWSGNPFGIVRRLHAAAQAHEAIDRVKDISFALDRILDANLPELGMGAVGTHIDRKRIIAAGHSYGANTTLLAVGARIARDGLWLDFRDPRFTAAVLISAPPFYGEGDPASILGRVAIPTLHITSTEDVIRIPGYHSGASDRIELFDAVADQRKALVIFEGGSHSMFTDSAATGGLVLNAKVKAATKELALAFFGKAFDCDRTGLAHWCEEWQPILARIASGTESGAQGLPAGVRAARAGAAPSAAFA
jgi:predicted dienelactone hydrolase